MELISDEALMGLIKEKRDRSAFETLIQKYKHRAYLFALKLLGNHDDAMDASQEAFVKVLFKAKKYENGRPFWPWFAAILRNCTRTIGRSGMRQRKAPDSEGLLELIHDESTNPAASFRSAELWASVLALPPKLREVLVLRYLEGMNYNEIAKILDIPINTVSTRIYAARKKLAKRYAM